MSIYHKILRHAGHDADCASRQACPTNCSAYRLSRLGSANATTIEIESAQEWAADALFTMNERGVRIPSWVPRGIVVQALGIDPLAPAPATSQR